MTQTRECLAPLQPFDQQAVEVLGRLRAAVASTIAAIPGDVRRATDLQRIAKIDMKLSWRLFKLVSAGNPLAAGPHVPGPANLRTFLRAASRVGVDEKVLAAVESAAVDFEQFVDTHASDRSTFDSMISAFAASEDADQVNLQQRRAAFRANRHLWGVQAASQVKCVFTDIGDDPTMVNAALVDGYVALRQLRHNAPLIVACARAADDLGAALSVPREPIDPRARSQHGLALLEKFCSEPLPRLREVPTGAGFIRGELASNGVGNRGSITCFTGWRAKNVASRYRAPNNMCATIHGAVRLPCEAITICLLTRRGLLGEAVPKLALYSDHMAELPYPIHSHRMDDLLVPDEGLAYLGHGAGTLSTPELPRLAEMAQYVFDRLGCDGEQFEVYRCRIAYPIMLSTVAVSIDLPEAPVS